MQESEEVTSFYVSEFLDFTFANDLFGCIGKVVEVTISPRRNNIRKWFGFARFVEVEEGRLLTARLDNILIGGKKIHVNLPRYQRRKKGGVRSSGLMQNRKGGQKKEQVDENSGFRVWANTRRGVRTFASVVTEDVVNTGSKVDEETKFCFKSKEENRMRFMKAYVGKVLVSGSTYNIQMHFEMEGVFAVKITPLGDNLCLLEESGEGFIEDLIGKREAWKRSWFSDVKKWEEGMIDD